MAGLDANGFTILSQQEITDELETEHKNVFGQNINVNPQSIFGQIIGIASSREAVIWEQLQLIFNAFQPPSANGTPLSNLTALNGVERKPAFGTKVEVILTGVVNTIVPQGNRYSNFNGDLFAQDSEVTIGAGGTILTSITAIETGIIDSTANTIQTIEDAVFGLDSVDNPSDGINGSDEETDGALRIRRNASTSLPSVGQIDGIKASIDNVDGVLESIVVENSGTVIVDGVPPQHIKAIVNGGDSAEIGLVIWTKKNTGTGTTGNTLVPVLDSSGNVQNINFSIATERDIFIEITIQTDPTYDQTTADKIKQEFVDYGNANFGISDDVIYNKMFVPANAFDGYNVTSLEIGAPTLATSDISIAQEEVSAWSITRITVNVV